jgi:hypothetical protein
VAQHLIKVLVWVVAVVVVVQPTLHLLDKVVIVLELVVFAAGVAELKVVLLVQEHQVHMLVM